MSSLPAAGVLASLHKSWVHSRRVRVLARHFADLAPRNGSVLDVGCGDGLLAAALAALRPDLEVRGIDIAARPGAALAVEVFDGSSLPFAGASEDCVLLADVLHHAEDPQALLAEAARVAKEVVLVKDHIREGLLAGPVLSFMDWVGNRPHGVPLRYDYWTRERWRETFARLDLRVTEWRERLGIYPGPADWVFGRSLHFIASLRPR